MSNKRTYPEGVPCWVDTEQSDVDAARDFYATLFGWTSRCWLSATPRASSRGSALQPASPLRCEPTVDGLDHVVELLAFVFVSRISRRSRLTANGLILVEIVASLPVCLAITALMVAR